MLSLPTPARRLTGVALATVLAAVAASPPAQAAPTAVERPADATALNFALPGQELALNFARKAG